MIVTDDTFMVRAMHDADNPLVNWANWRSIPNYLYQIRKIGNGPTPNNISFKAGCGNKGVGFWFHSKSRRIHRKLLLPNILHRRRHSVPQRTPKTFYRSSVVKNVSG
jgi:hypothetical protein